MENNETKIVCEYCIKRKVCKYTDDFIKIAHKVGELNDEHFKAWASCAELMDYRNIKYIGRATR